LTVIVRDRTVAAIALDHPLDEDPAELLATLR
jgi:hypothetical protein